MTLDYYRSRLRPGLRRLPSTSAAPSSTEAPDTSAPSGSISTAAVDAETTPRPSRTIGYFIKKSYTK